MPKRKTVPVVDIVRLGNAMMERDIPVEAKRAVRSLVESILHDTGNYHGFNYIAWSRWGWRKWIEDGEPEDKTPYLGDPDDIFFYE